MEKSRTSSRLIKVNFFTIVFILGSLFLSGCGQRSRVNGAGAKAPSGQASFDDIGNGQNGDRPYLALTPEDEAGTIRKSVEENAANKEFANQIVSASVVRAGIGAEIQIQTTKSSAPLIFKGDLKAVDLTFIGNYPESSGQRPDFTLYVSCSDQACRHADLFLSDQQGHKAAIVVNTEDRILHTTIPDGETEDQVKSSGLEKFAQDTKVHYNLTEIFPGKSTYTVTSIEADPKNSKTLFAGTIQNTEDGLVPTQVTALDDTNSVALTGIDPDDTVFQVSKKPAPATNNELPPPPAVIYEVKRTKPTTPKPTTTSSSQCVAKPTGKVIQLKGEVNRLSKDVLKECNSSWVQRVISELQSKNRYSKEVEDYLELYKESQIVDQPGATFKNPIGRVKDFGKMLDVLQKNGFPIIWGWSTEAESDFHYYKVGLDGELGVWQILPSNFKGLSISPHQAQEIEASTEAALTLYKGQMNGPKKDPDNIPMILARYNSRTAQSLKLYNDDFWALCGRSMDSSKGFKTITCPYVAAIISGMITSLDPAAFGMTNVGAMEAK